MRDLMTDGSVKQAVRTVKRMNVQDMDVRAPEEGDDRVASRVVGRLLPAAVKEVASPPRLTTSGRGAQPPCQIRGRLPG